MLEIRTDGKRIPRHRWHTGAVNAAERLARIRQVRQRLARDGPGRTRDQARDFERVTLPARDCDLVRDLLISKGVSTVLEIGLAYGSSALAIGEALGAVGRPNPRHVIVDPFQRSIWSNVGWDLLGDAGLAQVAQLMLVPSALALPKLLDDGVLADAAFVDGSHRFHEVFIDLYFLRKIVRPGGTVIMDDCWAPPVRAAARYFERNLGWTVIPDAFEGGTQRHINDDPAADEVPRCAAYRLPEHSFEPPFLDFQPF
jgi:predicted O-methyltransferase YrrM